MGVCLYYKKYNFTYFIAHFKGKYLKESHDFADSMLKGVFVAKRQ